MNFAFEASKPPAAPPNASKKVNNDLSKANVLSTSKWEEELREEADF
jgi:hypothetical protein